MSQAKLKVIENNTMDKENRSKSLEAAVSLIEKNYGKGSIMKLGSKANVDIESISTGSLGLYIALGIGGVPKGRIVEIYGPESSGKTTLVDLITLTHQQQKGDIIIDGTNSSEINQSSWKKQIGYVSQDTIIFDDTIGNNISMWQDNLNDKETYNKLRDAAKKANILNFIESLEKGFNTVVGDRGILLSGGQKQRIFIARELFRNPNILILDEATSALDSESEKNIQDSIESLKGKITVIIIAHRLSTIKKVDNIYLLDKGKIIEKGSYDDLKNDNNSKFSEIVELQLL